MADVTQRGGLVGPAGKFLRVLPGTLGTGPFKGYKLAFDADSPDGDAEWELSQPDINFQARNINANVIVGMDATRYASGISDQYYTSGGDVTQRGDYESLRGGRLPTGTIILYVEHVAGNRHFVTAPLVWVKK